MARADILAGRIAIPSRYFPIVRGHLPGYSIYHGKGANAAASTSLEVVSPTGTYPMPTAAVTLEAVSTSSNDASGGTGARTVTIDYIDANWTLQTQTVSTNGLTAVPFPTDVLRLIDVHCGTGGSYPTATQGTNAGTISIQESPGGTVWTQIGVEDGAGLGQSHIGAYSIPTGYTAYLLGYRPTVDSGKVATIRARFRHDADQISAPTGDIHDLEVVRGLSGPDGHDNVAPLGPLHGPADLWFLCKLDQAGAVSLDFELLIVEDEP